MFDLENAGKITENRGKNHGKITEKSRKITFNMVPFDGKYKPL